MRIIRMISGITILTASAWMGPALSEWLGVDAVFGYIGVSSVLAFIGGMIFGTLVSVYFIPIFYYHIYRKRPGKNR